MAGVEAVKLILKFQMSSIYDSTNSYNVCEELVLFFQMCTQIGTKSSNTRKHIPEPQFSHFAKNLCELLVQNPPSRQRIGNELVCNEFHSISHAIGACNQIS